jgi:hypothetical protein
MVYLTEYSGRTGNQLFQYCFSRILATELGLALRVPPITWFPEARPIPGKVIERPEIFLDDGDPMVSLRSLKDVVISCRNKRVKVAGYFERADYYIPYRDRIREWVGFRPLPTIRQVAIHIRATDFPVEYRPGMAYYSQCLQLLPAIPKVIFTDEPNYPLVRELNLPISRKGDFEAFLEMASSECIVTCFSTYSWWAAFLSKTSMVTQPFPLTGRFSVQFPQRCFIVPGWLHVQVPPMPDFPKPNPMPWTVINKSTRTDESGYSVIV